MSDEEKKIFGFVFAENVPFGGEADYLDQFDLCPVELDWSFRHGMVTDPHGVVGAICVTTWVEERSNIRAYPQMSAGGSIVPVRFTQNHLPAGTRVLVSHKDMVDGTGGTEADTTEAE